MAEAFHQWVQNMPWWEKLYYQLFDPQAITCSTHVPIPGIYFVGPVIVLVTVGCVLLWYIGKHAINANQKTNES